MILKLSFYRDADSHYYCDLREDWSSKTGELKILSWKIVTFHAQWIENG